MARGQWLSDEEVKQIHTWARRGLSMREIAAQLGRSYFTIRLELRGERRKRHRVQTRQAANMPLSTFRLSNRISERSRMEARTMTPQTVRDVFIDALLPAHFSKPRLAPEKFFADLTSDLCQAGFSVEVLQRAASILRGERAGTFPKIPTVLGACRRAADAIAEEAVQHQPDAGLASPGAADADHEPGLQPPESSESPVRSHVESGKETRGGDVAEADTAANSRAA